MLQSRLSLVAALGIARASGSWPALAVQRVRDLLLMDVGELTFVLACDSNASHGELPADELRQDPFLTGYSAAKVPLMEVIAAGAIPLVLVDNLCCRLEPTGRRILEGIAAVLQETVSGVVVTGSDESNMVTVQTGVGVTVVGAALPEQLLLGRSAAGDVVACVGTPKDGVVVAYEEGDSDIASVRDLEAVVRSGLVHEVVPVGSHGVAYEAEQISSSVGLQVQLNRSASVDLHSSAGASTCFVVTAPESALDELRRLVSLPVECVGKLT